MSEFEKESLSALLDGEADELELRRLLKSSETDSSLLDTWDRYNLVHSVLAGKAVPVKPAFAESIADKLAAEPALSAAPVAANGWQQNLAKMAIAASVAVVFVLGLQTANQQSTPGMAVNSESSADAAEAFSGQPDLLLAGGAQTEVDPEAQQRLLEYIESMGFDEDEPVRIEHIQDSPLYRLVNELQAKP